MKRVEKPRVGKACKDCGKGKPVTEFNKLRSAKDGYERICRSCASRHQLRLRYPSLAALRERRSELRGLLLHVEALIQEQEAE